MGNVPVQTPPTAHADSMTPPADCAKILVEIGIVVHKYKDREKHCKKGKQQSDHIVQNACFENSRGKGGIGTAAKYKLREAPCICLEDATNPTTQHGRKTASQRAFGKKYRGAGTQPTYGEARDANVEAMKDAKPELKDNDEAVGCIKIALKEYFEEELGLKEDTPVRTPLGGKFKPPTSTVVTA